MHKSIRKRELTIQTLMWLISSDKHTRETLFSSHRRRENVESGQEMKLLSIIEIFK